MELEGLRKHSIKSTLIFKNIDEKPDKFCETTSKQLAELLTSEVNFLYIYEELNMQVSRTHRGIKSDVTQTNNRVLGPKHIFAQFVNWRVVEGVCNKVIHLNIQRIVSQMFSQKLTERMSSVLKYRREYITNNPNVQIEL